MYLRGICNKVSYSGWSWSAGGNRTYKLNEYRHENWILRDPVVLGTGKKDKDMVQGRRLTVSQAIKALEAGGYLARQRSQADGRSVTLRLTDKGHKKLTGIARRLPRRSKTRGQLLAGATVVAQVVG